MITLGLDPHPGSHTVAALDDHGLLIDSMTVANMAQGHAALIAFSQSFAERQWAIEGAGNRFILPLVEHLLQAGDVVYHIPPNLTSQYRSRAGRKKNDLVDAQNAARVLLANPNLPLFTRQRHQRDFQDLTRVQRKLSEQLKSNRAAQEALDQDSPCRVALGAVIAVLEEQLHSVEAQLRTRVKKVMPSLLDVLGIGPVVAATLIGEVGSISRFKSPDQFAAYCEAAPVERGSGKNKRVQLNYGGNRRINWALHIVALTRIRCDQRTREFMDRLRAKGKTQRAALRILKTYIARELYRRLRRYQTRPSADLAG